MGSRYNLRKLQQRKKRNCSCHPVQEKQNQTRVNKNPMVRLERYKILDDPASCRYRFFIEEDNVVRVRRNKIKHPGYNYTLIMIISAVLCIFFSIYFKDNLHKPFTKLYSGTEHFYQKSQTCLLDIENSTQKLLTPKYFLEHNDIEVKNNSNIKLNLFLTGQDQAHNEIKKMIDNHFKKLRGRNEELNVEDMSFIEKECRRENSSFLSSSNLHQFNNAYLPSIVLTDYALKSKGARVLSTFDTEMYGTIRLKFWKFNFEFANNFLFQNFFHSMGPSSVLTPWTKPGDCWAFKGSRGSILFELSQSIKIISVSIDHIRENVTQNSISSAPKRFTVFGILGKSGITKEKINLGTFQYKTVGPSMQSFDVSKLQTYIRLIEIHFESNHGNKDYTCIYKIRVHGHP